MAEVGRYLVSYLYEDGGIRTFVDLPDAMTFVKVRQAGEPLVPLAIFEDDEIAFLALQGIFYHEGAVRCVSDDD